jgi:transposase-like protein
MIDKDELLNSKDFYDSFKNADDITSFFKTMYNRAIEYMLDAELDAHLDNEKHDKTASGNYRNGHKTKKIKTSFGDNEIKVPRDRDSSFNPILVPKRGNIAQGIENVIISLYAKGTSVSDIEKKIKEVYDFEVSTSTISRITNTITTEIITWQNRPLDTIYLIVWIDAIVLKVRENSKIINKTIYLAVGLNRERKKEVLGMWLGKNESSSFWMSVLTDLKARGVEDILITATDNLNGVTQTIRSVFPESQSKTCVAHQIRNACTSVACEDRKQFTADMKHIYNAPTKQAAEQALYEFADKWDTKYS